MSKLLKALRCAVPKTPAKSSVPLGSPLNKLRSLLTHSESTLPQPLIPLDLISFSGNVYRKPGEGSPHHWPKVLQLVTSPPHSCAHARTSATPFRSYIYFITRGHPGGGVSLRWDSQSWLSLLGLSRVTGHRSYRSPGTVAPQCAKCQNHRCYSLVAPGNKSARLGV